jgi:hypothetical protein
MGMRRSRSGKSRRKVYPVKSPKNNVEKSTRKNGLSAQTEAIELERDNLAKADSLLGCLVIAMEYGTDSAGAPYYPDVAQIARDLVQQSLRGLDAVNLQRPLRDKVKDEIRVIHVGSMGMREHTFVPPLLAAAPRLRAWRSAARGLRVHRRDYGSRVNIDLVLRRMH